MATTVLQPPQSAQGEKVKKMTAEQLAQASHLGRGELIEGVFIEMPPPQYKHGRVEGQIYRALLDYEDKFGIGCASGGEVGIRIRQNPATVRAADVLFISNERLAQLDSLDGYLTIAPELVVEVMSPSDSWSGVRRKLDDYFSINVLEIWVADPEEKTIHVHKNGGSQVTRYDEADTLTAEEILPNFSLPLAKVFKGL